VPEQVPIARASRSLVRGKLEVRGVPLKPAQIIIQPSDGPARVHQISAEQTLIGRSMHSDIKLTDTGISREHAAITREGQVYMLEDLQSTNGTRLNDKRIRSAELKSDDEIQIGRTILTFRMSS